MKIAIVTDWIYGGGSEKVVEQLHKLYPDAPIYTSYCSDEWRKKLDNKVVTGYLQHQPFRKLRKFLPLLRQWWFRWLDLKNFDLVLSVTGNGEAKFIRVPNGKHISYCNTPVHYYWKHYSQYLRQPGFRPKWLARLGLLLLVKPLRCRDFKAAQRVDYFIANSSQIRKDIKKYYNCDSVVIFPPVDTTRFANASPAKDFNEYITVGRQVPMKKTDLIIDACKRLKLPLTVIGNGPEHGRLVARTGPTVHLKTGLSDEEVAADVVAASAFIFASNEDFGIAPVEALAAGTPVIAYKAGGALDYVIPGVTGEFFEDQTVESLIEVLESFDPGKYKPDKLKEFAKDFSAAAYRKRMRKFIEDTIQKTNK